MKTDIFRQHRGVIDQLESNGYQAYFVGGCVRDAIQDQTPFDFDIATNATVDEMSKIFEKYHMTGKDFGTITVEINHHHYQITTFRSEQDYQDARRPEKVVFHHSLKEDLERRDFTVNAMAYHPDRGLFDHFHGAKHIQEKRLQTVGDPNKRFEEDGLRIMRAIRFCVTLGFTMEEKTKRALEQQSHRLEKVAIERINMELKKCLVGKYMAQIKPLASMALFSQFEDIKYELIPKIRDVVLRSAFFLQYHPTPHGFLAQLRVSKKAQHHILQVLQYQKRIHVQHIHQYKNLIEHVGYTNAKRILYLQGKDPKVIQKIKKSNECVFLSQLAITGDDLLDKGIVCQGKKVGHILRKLLHMVHKDPTLNDPETLLRLSHGLK